MGTTNTLGSADALANPVRTTDPPLSPRERDVLAWLLTDRSERQIAEALGLTPRTTHQYVVSVLRKFGVRGRIGLMAYWLACRRP